jgi:hypothetical protein
MGSPAPATGAYYGLAAILRDQTWEFDWWQQEVMSNGGLACPVCGEPLSTAPSTDAGASVIKFCKFAGDHRFFAPGDVVTPRHGQRMGRYG